MSNKRSLYHQQIKCKRDPEQSLKLRTSTSSSRYQVQLESWRGTNTVRTFSATNKENFKQTKFHRNPGRSEIHCTNCWKGNRDKTIINFHITGDSSCSSNCKMNHVDKNYLKTRNVKTKEKTSKQRETSAWTNPWTNKTTKSEYIRARSIIRLYCNICTWKKSNTWVCKYTQVPKWLK